MTKLINRVLYICHENPQQCDFCGEIAELRPYGPNGECICYDCGMKNKKSTERKFIDLLNKSDFVIAPQGTKQ